MRFLNVRSVTKKDTLVGRGDAKRDLVLFENEVAHGTPGETIVWDWSDIKIATASYLAGTCVLLFKRTLSGELDRFFVLSGMNENCFEELKLILNAEGLVMLVADRLRGDKIESAHPFGELDEPYRETFAQAMTKQPVSAAALHRNSKSGTGRPKIGKTAWINRLANLNRVRLLKRFKVGREFVYQLPF
jgi:hypothetical protein